MERPPVERPSLYEFAGGEPAFLALAAAHHLRCLEDPVLNHPFSHRDNPEHIPRLAAYWAEVLGGPPAFSERCGGHLAMIRMHANMGAADEMGERFVAAFAQAIDDADLPADPDFRAALLAYMRWATGEVMVYSPYEAAVPDRLAMPHWDWDGLVKEEA